jgi:threonine/homoserine/homoserine lactone efflux protein
VDGITNLPAFIVAGLMLNLIPGPDTMYVLGRSLTLGRAGGLWAAFGIGAGSLVHTTFAAIGLSAILAQSAEAFAFVKIAGALFLLWQAWLLLKSKPEALQIETAQTTQTGPAIFWQALATNVLNPKVALFFLAFLPQFVKPEAVNKGLTLAELGVIFTVNGTAYLALLVLFAAKVSEPLRTNVQFALWLRRSTGVLFAVLGAKLLLPETGK